MGSQWFESGVISMVKTMTLIRLLLCHQMMTVVARPLTGFEGFDNSQGFESGHGRVTFMVSLARVLRGLTFKQL